MAIKRGSIIALVGVALVTAIAIIGIAKFNPLGQSSQPEPLPQKQEIQVYFNLNDAKGANFIDPDRGFTRQGDIKQNK